MKTLRFTLVEVIVAVAILAMVSVVVSSTLMGFQRSHAKVEKLASELERGRAFDRVADLIRNAILFTWPNADEDDEEQLVFDGKEDELWFTSRKLPGADGAGAIFFVRMYLNDEKELCVDYRDKPLLPWVAIEDQTNYRTEVLAKNVESLTMRYADWNDDDEIDWLELWDQDDDDYAGRLPAAIGFTITFTDESTLSYLRRLSGISAFSGMATDE